MRTSAKKHPTGLTAAVLSLIGVLDTHWLHSGLSSDEWLVVVGSVSAIVSAFSPRF